MINTIKREIKYLITREERRMLNVEDIGYKILCFSLVSLGMIVLLSLFQLNYLKEFFERKKLI